MRLIVTFLLWFSLNCLAGPLGAWYKAPNQVPNPLDEAFSPSFVLLKVANFNQKGALWPLFPRQSIQERCKLNQAVEAWVTHRLKKEETLGTDAGLLLGKSLVESLKDTCIKKVEIDLEPLPSATPWLLEFLVGIKTTSKELEIRLAVPALSEKPLVGPTWNKESVDKVLEKIDGVDFMLYDTGLQDKREYAALLKNAIRFALNVSETSPIVLGVPAYQDRTKYHQLKVENLETVLEVLKSFPPKELVPLCLKKVRLSLYAGWTLSKELLHARKLEEWYRIVCKKDT